MIARNGYILPSAVTVALVTLQGKWLTSKKNALSAVSHGADIFDKKNRTRLDKALDMNKPLTQAYNFKEQLREIWTQPNKQVAKSHVRLCKIGAREHCATADENGSHSPGLQKRYSCMVPLLNIERKSRGD